MARGRKKKTEAEQSPAVAPAAGVGHNSLTDIQKRALFMHGLGKIERFQAQQAKIVADIRNERKRMKSDGYAKEAVDYALYLRKADPEAAMLAMRSQIEVAGWLNHPVGHQAELFGDGADRRPSVEKAFAEGEAAGMSGDICKAPEKYGPESEQAQQWIAGWHQGQQALMSGLAALETQEAQPEEGGGLPDAEGEATVSYVN